MKKFFLTSLFGIILLATPALALTSNKLDTVSGDNLTKIAAGSGHNELVFFGPKVSLQQAVGNIIKIILGLLGVIFMCYSVYAGWLWMASQGNSSDVDKALHILRNSIIGMAVILAAYVITSFVTDSLKFTTDSTGTDSPAQTSTEAATDATGAHVIDSSQSIPTVNPTPTQQNNLPANTPSGTTWSPRDNSGLVSQTPEAIQKRADEAAAEIEKANNPIQYNPAPGTR